MSEGSREIVRSSRRVLAELVVIVVGVLIALSADAWLDGFQDRRAEKANLATLRSDFVETLNELEDSQRVQDRVIASLTYLLERDLSQVAPDSIARWAYDGFIMSGGFDVALSGLRAIEGAGQVALFPLDFQLALSDFNALPDNVLKGDREIWSLQETLVFPFVAKQLSIAPYMISVGQLEIRLRSPSSSRLDGLTSLEGQNLAVMKIELLGVSQPGRHQLREQVRTLIEWVDVRLADA